MKIRSGPKPETQRRKEKQAIKHQRSQAKDPDKSATAWIPNNPVIKGDQRKPTPPPTKKQ